MNLSIEEKKNINIRLYPIYKMFAWDLLFYYAISFLFLTEVKGFSSADVVLLDVSFYTLFKALLQLPSIVITDKLGKRMSLIFGNVSLCICILLVLVCNSLLWLAISEFFMALGYAIKSIAEPNILYDSLPAGESSRKKFATLDGRGSSFYYYLNAVSCGLTGILYTLNPYYPVVMCLVFCIISTLLSYCFYSLREASPKNHTAKNNSVPKISQRLKEYSSQLKYIFKHIFKSQRLRNLIIFYGLFQSLIIVTTTLTKSLLTDMQISSAYFGIIYAAFSILSGIGSSLQNFLDNHFKNRVLTVFAILFVSSCLVSGLCVICQIPLALSIFLVLNSAAIREAIKGPFYTLYKRYLGSFSTPSARTKIYSTTYLFDNICSAIVALGISRLLMFETTAVTFVILGIFYGVIFLFLLNHMRTRVGLKPEEYSKSDTDLSEIH